MRPKRLAHLLHQVSETFCASIVCEADRGVVSRRRRRRERAPLCAGSHCSQLRWQRDTASTEHRAERALGFGTQPVALALHREFDLAGRSDPRGCRLTPDRRAPWPRAEPAAPCAAPARGSCRTHDRGWCPCFCPASRSAPGRRTTTLSSRCNPSASTAGSGCDSANCSAAEAGSGQGCHRPRVAGIRNDWGAPFALRKNGRG